jgi:hypothetical protein
VSQQIKLHLKNHRRQVNKRLNKNQEKPVISQVSVLNQAALVNKSRQVRRRSLVSQAKKSNPVGGVSVDRPLLEVNRIHQNIRVNKFRNKSQVKRIHLGMILRKNQGCRINQKSQVEKIQEKMINLKYLVDRVRSRVDKINMKSRVGRILPLVRINQK